MIRRRAVIGVAAVAALLVGCSSTAGAEQGGGDSLRLADLGHVHGLAVDGTTGTLFAAAHGGLFEVGNFSDDRFTPAADPGPIAGRAQDTMGFEMHGHRMYASGHPDPHEDLDLPSPNLGLITSVDHGQTWTPVSLHGEVDFHDLAVADLPDGTRRVYGYDAGAGAVRVSSDGGETWVEGARLPIRDLTADPREPDTVYATTEQGLALSTDAAATFSLLPSAPPLLLVEWTESGLVGVAVDGAIWWSTPDGGWRSTGSAEGGIEAMGYTAEPHPLLLLADGRGIVASADGGDTWETLLPR